MLKKSKNKMRSAKKNRCAFKPLSDMAHERTAENECPFSATINLILFLYRTFDTAFENILNSKYLN